MEETVREIEEGLDVIKKESKKNLFLGFETPFVAILVWQALETIDSETTKKIVERGVKELLKEKSENWSFNYWLKSSDKFKTEPYPDDLDDTFCALSVINNFDRKLIKGKDLAKIASLLIRCEKKVGGPYKTWLIKNDEKEKWSDVDLAVNCNIGYFLKSQEIELKKINDLIDKAIEEQKLYSPYYKGIWPIVYFISRSYEGKNKGKLIDLIEKEIKEDSSQMEKAIALGSLIRLESKNETFLDSLRKKIEPSNNWQKEDFYFYVDGKTKYIGHKALTTALVIEALNLDLIRRNKKIKEETINKIEKEIINESKNKLKWLEPKSKKNIDKLLEKLLGGNAGQIITLTPYWTAECLKAKTESKFVIEAGVINVLGWLAYTLYDDLMDGDRTNEWLPIANIICRQMNEMFNRLMSNDELFRHKYEEIMTKQELANWWEIKNCRQTIKEVNYKNKEKLSNRSLGHALTSLAVLYKAKIKPEDIGYFQKFFEYFLAARQMNDDAHDWEDDWGKGQINSASAEILKLSKKTDGVEKMKVTFWENVFDDYAKKIFRYCLLAKKYIRKISCFKETVVFDRMVNKVIKSTQKAVEEKAASIDFINNYYQK